jgi:predicted DNA-binding protein (MmcQ/YjbR family)
MANEDPRLDQIAAACMALPETEQISSGQYSSFKVRGKTFVYFLVDHHGDGRVAINFKVPPGENSRLAAADPVRFYIPAYVGPKGWVGLDLLAAEPDWDEIGRFVTDSYALIAPRKLAALARA